MGETTAVLRYDLKPEESLAYDFEAAQS